MCAIAVNIGVQKLRSIDITAAFLQSNALNRDIFVKPPKDIMEERILWHLRKPLYGLCDAGRRFWLKVKEILEKNGYKKLTGDEAFYYKNDKKGDLEGMILLHVDDFLMAGTNTFTENTTKLFQNELKVSKIQDGSMRFCGVDLELRDNKIYMNMDEYTKTIKEIPIRPGSKKQTVTWQEHLDVKRVCGQAQWIALTNRPDIAFGATKMATFTANSTLEDLMFVNKIVRKIHARRSLMIFERIGNKEDLIVHGLSDAAFKRVFINTDIGWVVRSALIDWPTTYFTEIELSKSEEKLI